MFCKKCGKDIDIKNKICPECGEETGFLKGIDGSEKPEHLEIFENKINRAFNSRPPEAVDEDAEYEDISSYQTSSSQRERRNTVPKRTNQPRRNREDTYDEDTGNTWKILAAVCGVIILICLIIIISVSCNSKKNTTTAEETTIVPTTSATETTTEATTQPATEKSIAEYVDEALVDDSSAIETVQGFYSNFEAACAGNDLDAFADLFSASYTKAEIKEIYNQYHQQCGEYSVFIPGITNTVSCDKYIYVYIAATTNLETNDYVENTFVLSSDGGAFKLDMKSDGASAFMNQAPAKLS